MNNDNHYYMSQNDICMFNMCPDFCPARPAGMSCYTGFSRTSRTKIRTNRTPGNPGYRTHDSTLIVTQYALVQFCPKDYENAV